MTKFIELHIIQNYPPANLNRDANGMPKSTIFGGYPRARISSQCQKRTTRQYYQKNSGIDPAHFAHRSRSWLPELKRYIIDKTTGFDLDSIEIAAKLALEVLGAKFEDKKKKVEVSNTILFLGKTEIAAIGEILIGHWPEIESGLKEKTPALPSKDPNIPKLIEKALANTGKPGDIALFGRMMASLPTVNVDAAVQMAHAIGVNALEQQFDFFTAVDDLGSNDDQGADHLGETGYNSSAYYRYANVDIDQLIKNLGSSEVAEILTAFIKATIESVPSGHQNSFAAHTMPSAVMLTVRKTQPLSLVDAFEQPIRAGGGKGLLDRAIAAIDTHWEDLSKMYGNRVEYAGIVTRSSLSENLQFLKQYELQSVEESIDGALKIALSA